MQPPSRGLAPGAGTAMPPPPGRWEAAPGDQRAPPTPPPPSHSGPRADGGRLKKRRPQTPSEQAAAPGVRGHHGRGRRPHALPAAGRRRAGGAQDSANGTALSEAGPGKTGARTRAGGSPPPPPPPHWPVGGRPDRARRLRPPGNPHGTSIPRGGTPETTDGRPTPEGVGGQGGRPPDPPPAAPPFQLGGHRSGPPPPRSRGDAPPPPQKGPRRGGGGCSWTCTPRAPAPPAACSRGDSGRGASPHQRAGATRAPRLGAAHGGAPEQYGGRALHDPPVTTAHSGRAEGGFRSAGAPGGAVHGPPLTPPQPRGGTATPTARARQKGVRRRHEDGQD